MIYKYKISDIKYVSPKFLGSLRFFSPPHIPYFPHFHRRFPESIWIFFFLNRNSESHDLNLIEGQDSSPGKMTTFRKYDSLISIPLSLPRLEFRYSIQIRIATLYLTQRGHSRLFLPPLRSIIRTVHIRHRVILRGGTVELTAREISVQSPDLILHLILNANVRRLISHQRSKLIHVSLRARLELPRRLLTRGIRREWSILIPGRSRTPLQIGQILRIQRLRLPRVLESGKVRGSMRIVRQGTGEGRHAGRPRWFSTCVTCHFNFNRKEK